MVEPQVEGPGLALDEVRVHLVGVVLLDGGCGGLDGIGVLRRCRQDQQGDHDRGDTAGNSVLTRHARAP